MSTTSDLPGLIERWFTDRLMRHRGASANTIASYRDTFRLLFSFTQERLRRPPSKLALTDLDAPFICAFLDDLEARRSATAQTRNLRLTAIRSFFRYASFEAPAYSAHIQRVLAIPTKRSDKRQVNFLTRHEIDAILSCPDQSTWIGRRDHALLLLAVQTGLRLSELVGLDRNAVTLGRGAHVQCVGKGRKERCTPLTKTAQHTLRAWLKEPRRRGATALFPNMHGGQLSADGVQSLLNKYVTQASDALLSGRSGYRPMSYGTPPPWNCCRPASIVPLSPFGSATSRSRQPRPISTRISNSKRPRLPSSSLMNAKGQNDFNPTTDCLNS